MRLHTLESKEKMRQAKLRYYASGGVHPNKGKKLPSPSEETREKLRAASIRAGCQPPSSRGLVRSPETRLKIALAKSGANSHFWKGGRTKQEKIIRESTEYKLWRESVFKRDNYTCQGCGERGGLLNADHIQPFCNFPELRFELSNGRTLCRPCHKKTDTWGYKAKGILNFNWTQEIL